MSLFWCMEKQTIIPNNLWKTALKLTSPQLSTNHKLTNHFCVPFSYFLTPDLMADPAGPSCDVRYREGYHRRMGSRSIPSSMIAATVIMTPLIGHHVPLTVTFIKIDLLIFFLILAGGCCRPSTNRISARTTHQLLRSACPGTDHPSSTSGVSTTTSAALCGPAAAVSTDSNGSDGREILKRNICML